MLKPGSLVLVSGGGYSTWPGRIKKIENNGLVSVEFYGSHDAAMVSPSEVWLYSEKTKTRSVREVCRKKLDFLHNYIRDTLGQLKLSSPSIYYTKKLSSPSIYYTK